jgi:hypothetical protein
MSDIILGGLPSQLSFFENFTLRTPRMEERPIGQPAQVGEGYSRSADAPELVDFDDEVGGMLREVGQRGADQAGDRFAELLRRAL